MPHLPCLTRSHSWAPMIPFTRLLWSEVYVHMLLLSFSTCSFSDWQSLKIENENNNTKTRTTEVSYRDYVPRVLVYIETNPGWLELPLTGIYFYGPSLFEPFFCSLSKGSTLKGMKHQQEPIVSFTPFLPGNL